MKGSPGYHFGKVTFDKTTSCGIFGDTVHLGLAAKAYNWDVFESSVIYGELMERDLEVPGSRFDSSLVLTRGQQEVWLLDPEYPHCTPKRVQMANVFLPALPHPVDRPQGQWHPAKVEKCRLEGGGPKPSIFSSSQ